MDKLVLLEEKIDALIKAHNEIRAENRLLIKENEQLNRKCSIFSAESYQTSDDYQKIVKENKHLKIKQFRIEEQLSAILERVNNLTEK